MPRRRKSDLSLYTSHARAERRRRSMEDYDQRQNRLMKERLRRRASRKRLKQINGNIIGTHLVEVTKQESKSDVKNSNIQRGGETSKDSGAAESEDESKDVCVLKMEIEKEDMETNIGPIDCDIKEEGE